MVTGKNAQMMSNQSGSGTSVFVLLKKVRSNLSIFCLVVSRWSWAANNTTRITPSLIPSAPIIKRTESLEFANVVMYSNICWSLFPATLPTNCFLDNIYWPLSELLDGNACCRLWIPVERMTFWTAACDKSKKCNYNVVVKDIKHTIFFLESFPRVKQWVTIRLLYNSLSMASSALQK